MFAPSRACAAARTRPLRHSTLAAAAVSASPPHSYKSAQHTRFSPGRGGGGGNVRGTHTHTHSDIPPGGVGFLFFRRFPAQFSTNPKFSRCPPTRVPANLLSLFPTAGIRVLSRLSALGGFIERTYELVSLCIAHCTHYTPSV